MVAIKSVSLSKLASKLKANLYDEIDILKSMEHPHIVALQECIEGSRHIHLVMEFCPWSDLSIFMKKREAAAKEPDLADLFKRYPNPREGGFHDVIVRHFTQQLASAIGFLRLKSLIHRDIKPQNLLLAPSIQFLDRQGSGNMKYGPKDMVALTPVAGLPALPMLKLADFGFAKVLPKTALAETLCGSPLYMAPEILKYEKYDASADLWSVGAVIYELCVGKPPFRAANHIELLRTIEMSKDVIRFPREPVVSKDIQGIISALLKKSPVERISFEQFLDHPLITGEIPGVAKQDRPAPKPSAPEGSKNDPAGYRKEKSQATAQASPGRSLDESEASDKFVDAVEHVGRTPARRPSMVHNATAPAAPAQTSRKPAPQGPGRPSSRDDTAALQSNVKRNSLSHQSRGSRDESGTPKASREAKEVEDQAAEDVAFERDYVVVEKRAVEVNAFADELAASPRINSQRNEAQTALQRRNTTQNTPQGGTQPIQTTSNRAIQIASGKRPDHARQPSFEKRARIGTSAISKAINMASGRLLNLRISPPLGLGRGGPSPPLYAPFPAYPVATGPLLLEDSKSAKMDEDTKALHLIEEFAHRSDVVYGFAEVKYRQLNPIAPSEDHGLGLQEAGIPEKDNKEHDDDLTLDAVITLSEEALVLYVKALSLLARAMDIAGGWWTRKNRIEPIDEVSPGARAQNQMILTTAGPRVNKVVQWARDRFNEIFEKAEFVRRKLIESQKRLPVEHPMHPDNQPSDSTIGVAASSGSVRLSPGVSAEKLIYLRALEMGKSAALSELVGEDFANCDISYVTAIRMLEAVLETDDEPTSSNKIIMTEKDPSQSKATPDDLVNPEDKEHVMKGESMFILQKSR